MFGKENFTMKRKGALVYNRRMDRMDIRFNLENYYGGLHCGTGMEVLLDNEWVPTRIEFGDQWYLVGIETDQLPGLIVRI